MKFSKEEVLAILPHRDPFLFVDEVLEVKSAVDKVTSEKDIIGATVKAKYTPQADHVIFKGHFPGNPIFPGVTQIEMMAQVSIFGLKLLCEDIENRHLDVALLSVEACKFRKPVTPGMELTIETKCLKMRKAFLQNECSIYHDGELISQCTIFASYKVS